MLERIINSDLPTLTFLRVLTQAKISGNTDKIVVKGENPIHDEKSGLVMNIGRNILDE